LATEQIAIGIEALLRRMSGQATAIQSTAMPKVRNIKPEKEDVLLLVGTMKGAFILRANKRRAQWEIGGPYFPGSAVYAMAYDDRDGAGPQSMHWGALLRSTDDFGKNRTTLKKRTSSSSQA